MAKKHVRPTYVPKSERKKKPMSRELKIGLGVGTCLVAVAVAVAIIVGNYTGPNWIITNLDKDGGKAYHKLGEVGAIEGFTRDMSDTTKIDKRETEFWLMPDDKDSAVTSYTINGVKNTPEAAAEEAVKNTAGMSPDAQLSEIMTGEIAGRACTYFFSSTQSQETKALIRMVCCYFPAKRDASILVAVTTKEDDKHPLPSDEELLAYVQKAAEKIKFEK